MKILRKILAAAYLALVASDFVCASTVVSTINDRKNPAQENREVSGFSGLSSSGSYYVFITMGNTESLRMEGDPESIREIETKVENGILKIRNRKQLNHRTWNNRGRVNIYIHAKELNNILLSGSGSIKVNGKPKDESLKNTISGSGSIEVNMDVNEYTGTISGSGTILARGVADNTKITITGSGNFEGKELHTANTLAKLSGSGNIDIHAAKSLDAVLSGSGDIRYTGNAAVNSTKSGSGRILQQ